MWKICNLYRMPGQVWGLSHTVVQSFLTKTLWNVIISIGDAKERTEVRKWPRICSRLLSSQRADQNSQLTLSALKTRRCNVGWWRGTLLFITQYVLTYNNTCVLPPILKSSNKIKYFAGTLKASDVVKSCTKNMNSIRRMWMRTTVS